MRTFGVTDQAYRLWHQCLGLCKVPSDKWFPGVYEDFSGFAQLSYEDWLVAKGEYLFSGQSPRYKFAQKINSGVIRSLNISLWTYTNYECYPDTAELGRAMGEEWQMAPLSSRTPLIRRSARFQTQAVDVLQAVSEGLFPWHRNMRP